MTSPAETQSALSFYRVTSVTTGVFLLLVVAEMILKYAFGQTIWSGGSVGLLGLVPNPVDDIGLPDSGTDMSKTLIQIHGLLYVVYLFADFRIWRLAELKFKDFLVIAMGGIVPLSSFFIERSYHKKLEVIFAEKAGKQN
jgi:integral membrane protein